MGKTIPPIGPAFQATKGQNFHTYFSSRERRRSFSTLPPVCSAGQ